VLPAMRAIKKLEQQGANVQFVGQRNRVNVNRLPPAITNTKRQYTYRVRVTGVNQLGQQVEQFIHVSTDLDNLTRGMIEDEASRLINNRNRYDQVNEMEAFLEHGMQRAQVGDFNVTSRGDFIINR